ncbi:phosphate ABC transporter permease subunit PstC [Candidatus Phycosocius spiralis]|uniref:Phosphate transport system permease protein n=1 Tax=Candidatus Phycosocius spiralis TaxID=2815099 RepID=A0ABQ4PVG5_9PROT|nr:phosphate ABC transporter permease subunit PstC [Candidatus Phycosocius spiralis]GIU66966.1 phosphate transport system permease protein [Candidatus Phycosocius spiralis]
MNMFANLPVAWLAVGIIVMFGIWAWHTSATYALSMIEGEDTGRLSRLNSLPIYHGWYVVLWVVVPALALLLLHELMAQAMIRSLLSQSLAPDILALPQERLDLFFADAGKIAFGGVPSQRTPELLAAGAAMASISTHLSWAFGIGALALAVLGYKLARSRLSVDFRARNAVEAWIQALMIVASGIAILTTIGIVLSLLFETLRFFSTYSPIDFLFGTHWSPQVAIRADQIGQSGAFGAVPLFAGTALIMLIAMAIAVPVGLGSAIYLSEYASSRFRTIVKPVLELLAGIPTVVFGFFALLTVAPLIKSAGMVVGLDVSAQSALAAGLVMGIMIIPFISSLSDDVINAVPQALRDGSYAMGATKSETIGRVVIPAALPGIVGSILLAVSKALGETMIVTMAAGQNANLTLNPLDMVTTVTVQIVTLLTGDQEYDSPKTHAAFALGFVLFFVTLILNIIALRVVQKYREHYE